MRSFRTLAILGAAALLIAGCTGSGNGGDETPDGGGVETVNLVGSWRLTTGTTADGDLALSDDAPVTLDVTEQLEVSGQSACNRYVGSVEVDGASVTFSPLASTRMACEEPVMAIEAAYLGALAEVERGARDGESLTLSGAGVELVFGPRGADG